MIAINVSISHYNNFTITQFTLVKYNFIILNLKSKTNNHTFDFFIGHSFCQIRFKNVKNVEIFDVGTTIGCHTGTGTVALFFTGDKREDSK